MQFTADNTGRCWEALHRYHRFDTRPPVTLADLPAPVTFTHDMFRAVPSGYGFDVRREPVRRLDA